MPDASATSLQVAARLSALDARHGWLADALLALGVLGGSIAQNRGLGDASAAFAVGLAAPLAVRRRHPRAVFAVVATVAFAQWLADVRTFADVALLVAFYSVAAGEDARSALLAGLVLEIGIVMASARWAVGQPVKVAIGLSGLATAAGVIGFSVRARRALVSSLHDRAAQLELERDQQGRLAAAAERARIARDMHDIVAHHLSVVIALSDGASYHVTDAPERARKAMLTASKTGRQALAEMRRLLGVLRDESEPAFAPQPGIAQIAELVARVRAAGLPVEYRLTGRADELEPGVQLTAHRVVQEALTNTLKHAGDGARVEIDVSCTPDAVSIDVRDDGQGAAAPGGPEGGGLRGMRERAAVYGGEVHAGPRDDGGWEVRVRLAGERSRAVPA